MFRRQATVDIRSPSSSTLDVGLRVKNATRRRMTNAAAKLFVYKILSHPLQHVLPRNSLAQRIAIKAYTPTATLECLVYTHSFGRKSPDSLLFVRIAETRRHRSTSRLTSPRPPPIRSHLLYRLHSHSIRSSRSGWWVLRYRFGAWLRLGDEDTSLRPLARWSCCVWSGRVGGGEEALM